jgi:hypothetical protein
MKDRLFRYYFKFRRLSKNHLADVLLFRSEDMYFHDISYATERYLRFPHKHHKHWFADNLRYTNKPSEMPRIKKQLDVFQRNLTSFLLPNLFLPSSFMELKSYEIFIEDKYGMNLSLVDAVVFVPKKEMTIIKTRVIVEGGHGIDNGGDNNPSSLIDPRAEELRNREFDDREDDYREDDDNEPQFNEPENDENYRRIVEGGKIVGSKTWVETMSLFGCCCKMTLKELHDEISKMELDNVIFKDSTQITDEDLEYDGQDNLNVIFLCEETLKNFTDSINNDAKQLLHRKTIGERFNVAVMNDYFIDNAERLTFAHEVGHILLGHLENTTELYVNRETQANFMASLMLNDKIDSIYMQYKTRFQPREYQRTMLFHNDFDSTNFTKALLEVLKLK